jgi:hypothetical protein
VLLDKGRWPWVAVLHTMSEDSPADGMDESLSPQTSPSVGDIGNTVPAPRSSSLASTASKTEGSEGDGGERETEKDGDGDGVPDTPRGASTHMRSSEAHLLHKLEEVNAELERNARVS